MNYLRREEGSDEKRTIKNGGIAASVFRVVPFFRKD
jgi:hypothetical protein